MKKLIKYIVSIIIGFTLAILFIWISILIGEKII